MKRSWVIISTSQILANIKIYKDNINNYSDIMAVVKADGYGHGAIPVASALQGAGIKHFAVSNIYEAIELREAGIKGQILILGYTPIEYCHDLVTYDITQALISEDYTRDIIKTGIRIKCQYSIDTGMNRIGLDANDVIGCVKQIRLAAERLMLTGLFTHLCAADTPSEDVFTKQQQQKFKAVVEMVSDLKLPYIHTMNSAGGLWHTNEYSTLNRLGIVMYGLKPDYQNTLPQGIEPAMTWKSVISMIKTVRPGETIGYGRTYRVENEMRVATIPTGYADGYNRLLSNKGFVLLHGKKAPIVGRVCMDQFMIDVTDIYEAKPYDEVVLLGKNGDLEFNADDMAKLIGTIGYEIVCDIGKRVHRVYIE